MAKARPNPLLLGLDPLRYFLRCLRSVKAPDLEQALLVLPFHYVSRFVPMLLQVNTPHTPHLDTLVVTRSTS